MKYCPNCGHYLREYKPSQFFGDVKPLTKEGLPTLEPIEKQKLVTTQGEPDGNTRAAEVAENSGRQIGAKQRDAQPLLGTPLTEPEKVYIREKRMWGISWARIKKMFETDMGRRISIEAIQRACKKEY